MEYMIVLETNQDLNTLKKNVKKELKDIKIEKIIQLSLKKIKTKEYIISILTKGNKIELDNDNITREWIHSYELKKLNLKNGRQKYKIVIIPENNIKEDSNYNKKFENSEKEKALANLMRLGKTSMLRLKKEKITREYAHEKNED